MQETDAKGCPRCGEAHDIVACPYVKAIEYGSDTLSDKITRIEFLTPADYPPLRTPAPDDAAGEYLKLGPKG